RRTSVKAPGESGYLAPLRGRRGNLEPAKRQPQEAIALERAPVAADDAENDDQLTLCCREIDPNLFPSVQPLLDPPVQTGGRARDPSPCRIEYGLAVICLSVSYFELNLHAGRSLYPGSDAIDTVLVEPASLSGEVMAAFGRYRDKPQ